MFLIIQLPIADSRPFLTAETGLLRRPNWPSPVADRDFVRAFGHIRERWRGGLPGWVGESEICEAKRALRLDRPAPFAFRSNYGYNRHEISIKVGFRRFYADGYAVCKYEIGLLLRPSTSKYLELDEEQTWALLRHILQLGVSVPNPLGDDVRCTLGDAGRPLARLYRLSSSSADANQPPNTDWWVEPGRPVLLFELRKNDYVDFPFPPKSVPTKTSGLSLDFYTVPWQGLRLPLWTVEQREQMLWRLRNARSRIRAASRALRLTLLRLHAERECLQRVLSNVADGRIAITPGTEASEVLQEYLNEATRRIGRLERPSRKQADGFDQSLAYFADDFVRPGRRDETLANLSSIRGNVLRKVEEYLAQQLYVQLWQNQGGEFDLRQLATELAKLHGRLAAESGADREVSVAAVASAQKAAAQGNGPKVLAHLAKAGKLALEVAKDIGVSLAAAAIQGALGI